MDLKDLLQTAVSQNASDIHLVVGARPTLRVAKELKALDLPPLESKTIEALLIPYLKDDQKHKLEKEGRLNYAQTMAGLGRFRISLYRSHGEYGAALRVLALPVRPLMDIGLPVNVLPLLHRTSGMLIVTGATGSGKSTTLASIVDYLNKGDKPRKVITIEDPIEYEHSSANGIVVQREVGTDTPTFYEALVDALRQDPNIIVIGELRDPESIMTSLLAAETGHFVLTTLHTPDAPSTITRILSAVPSGQQDLVRSLLGSTLQAVIAQELLPRVDKKGLSLVAEVLVATEAVRRIIRENKPEQLYDIIQTSSGLGMVSRDQSLVALVKKGLLAKEVAVTRMRMPQLLGA